MSWVCDSQPSQKFPIWTRANAGEVAPHPMSPLTTTIGLTGPGEAGWRDAYVAAGVFDHDEFETGVPNTMACFGGYLFLNMSTTRIYGVRMPGLTPEMVDLQYFGDMPGITPYADEARPDDVSPEHTARCQRYLDELFARTDLAELRADRDQVDRVVARRIDFTSASDQELIDYARSHLALYRRLFTRHILVSGASGVGIGTVTGVCAAIGSPELVMTLVSGLGEVDSAAPSWAMWELGRMVAGSADLTAEFDQGITGLETRLRARAGSSIAARELMQRLDEFLRRFGSRGPNEWELRSPTWGTAPQIPLAAIDRMRLAPEHESPQARFEARHLEREAATEKVRTAIAADAEASATFEAGLRVAHLYSAGRERTKTTIIKIVHEMRLAVREVGRRMVERGHLDRVEQVFQLVDLELDPFLEQPQEYRDLLRDREAYYLSLWDYEPPFVSHGSPPSVTEWAKRGSSSAARLGPGARLTGIPGCPGLATGRARIILDPADPAALQPGDVLVAPITDPAWTPLFVPAAAVVVDVGAQVSHAVIVSRELGLPCVVSVTGATVQIPDGALIEVDGTAGTVTILEV